MFRKSMYLIGGLFAFVNISFAATDVEKCNDLFENRNFDELLIPCKRAAEQGDSNAQFHLAFMYANGEGVAQDEQLGLFWGRKAAEQGHADAQYNLASMYESDSVAGFDLKKADFWYKKAFASYKKLAEQGDANAQYSLANMYQYYLKVPNYKIAYMWMWLAAQQGNFDAESGLKDIEGELKPKQLKQAQDMAKKCLAANYKNCIK